jgi:hypothetical protein
MAEFASHIASSLTRDTQDVLPIAFINIGDLGDHLVVQLDHVLDRFIDLRANSLKDFHGLPFPHGKNEKADNRKSEQKEQSRPEPSDLQPTHFLIGQRGFEDDHILHLLHNLIVFLIGHDFFHDFFFFLILVAAAAAFVNTLANCRVSAGLRDPKPIEERSTEGSVQLPPISGSGGLT